MQEKTIYCVNDIISAIAELYRSQDELLWYRGSTNMELPLRPSVQREQFKPYEQQIANEFYLRANLRMKEKPDRKNYSAWMAIMQHYGLPTRLLDWSESPLVAAFFATYNIQEDDKNNSCVWILKPGRLNEAEGFGHFLFPMDSTTALKMLFPAFKGRQSSPHYEDRILACYPVENDLRMFTQHSAFTLHNSDRMLEQVPVPDLVKRLIIPHQARERILCELRICGITLSNIFPDIEHIAREIKEKYALEE